MQIERWAMSAAEAAACVRPLGPAVVPPGGLARLLDAVRKGSAALGLSLDVTLAR